jgi:hypothetical protein
MIETMKPKIGEVYRIPSFVNPFFGIGTVVSIKDDGTGVIENEEFGRFHFNSFDLSYVGTDLGDLIVEGVGGMIAEIKQLKITHVLPEKLSSFAEMHDYIDANVLLLKHVLRSADWMDAPDEERERQAEIDNLVMEVIDKELSKGLASRAFYR